MTSAVRRVVYACDTRHRCCAASVLARAGRRKAKRYCSCAPRGYSPAAGLTFWSAGASLPPPPPLERRRRPSLASPGASDGASATLSSVVAAASVAGDGATAGGGAGAGGAGAGAGLLALPVVLRATVFFGAAAGAALAFFFLMPAGFLATPWRCGQRLSWVLRQLGVVWRDSQPLYRHLRGPSEKGTLRVALCGAISGRGRQRLEVPILFLAAQCSVFSSTAALLMRYPSPRSSMR